LVIVQQLVGQIAKQAVAQIRYSRAEKRRMAKEALELWQGLPADTRRMLLSNVWCGECRKAVTIVDYHAELKGVVVLQGFCGTCGHKVARVIDDLAPKKPKQGKK